MANENKTSKGTWKMVIAGNNVKENEYPTAGEEINAIVRYFTGRMLGNFILTQALEEVKENEAKIEAFKQKLLNKEVQ